MFFFFLFSFLTRELRKTVTGYSEGSDYVNKGLVDHMLTFRNSAVLWPHISFDISITTCYVRAHTTQIKGEVDAAKETRKGSI